MLYLKVFFSFIFRYIFDIFLIIQVIKKFEVITFF